MLNGFVILQFAQIAEGLGKAKVVLAFVSKQYANSENCRMEIQFALKVKHKMPILSKYMVSINYTRQYDIPNNSLTDSCY